MRELSAKLTEGEIAYTKCERTQYVLSPRQKSKIFASPLSEGAKVAVQYYFPPWRYL